MGHVNPKLNCVGCTACVSVCPKKAIYMTEDNQGFYIAAINNDQCIACGICEKVCPIITSKKIRENNMGNSYYMFSKDIGRRIASCSGGVFFALAEAVINEGGFVCGCIWDDSFMAKHVCTNDIETVKKMRGSKYVQSNMLNCFEEIKKHISLGHKVLFSGTGCQTTALENLIEENNKHLLITCAVICGGVPSPKVWNLYKNLLEQKYGSKLVHLEMRDKKHGWLMPEIYAEFSNGQKIREVLLQHNLYGTNFQDGLFVNDECMHCSFKLSNVSADILLSDDWGITAKRLQESNNKGSSAVIALTDLGDRYLAKIKSEMITYNGSITDIIESHHVLTKDHSENPNRQDFLENVNSTNIEEMLTKYEREWEKKVNMSSLVKLLYKIGVYTFLYNIKWKFKHRKS